MKKEQKGNKSMFYIGIVFIIISAILLLGNFMGESTFPAFLGLLGIISAAASKFRLIK
jgi:uncharacterized membrane protein HdeD (DUF308 family)